MSEDGGSAFPAQPTQYIGGVTAITAHAGMSLRDYFAAAFLNGWIATYGADAGHSDLAHEANAKSAYKAADAMLRAREEK